MEKNIYANLNLTDSISEFQEDVKKLLDLTKIEEWDGRVIKEREEKIRQTALVLAGQCVAILLLGLRQKKGGKKGIMLFQPSFHIKVISDERDNSRRHAPML